MKDFSTEIQRLQDMENQLLDITDERPLSEREQARLQTIQHGLERALRCQHINLAIQAHA